MSTINSKLDFEAINANKNITARNYWKNRLEDYVLEEISSDFSVISDGDKMKEIKEEVLKYVSCFTGKKSKQIKLKLITLYNI